MTVVFTILLTLISPNLVETQLSTATVQNYLVEIHNATVQNYLVEILLQLFKITSSGNLQ